MVGTAHPTLYLATATKAIGDGQSSSGSIRRYLRRRGIRLTIPRRSLERRRGKFDEEGVRGQGSGIREEK